MLAFARETKLSETTFVQSATDDAADYRTRIWTTGGEVPFAGHPTLGTAVARAVEEGVREASYVQQTHAGLQPVEVEVGGAAVARGSMLQLPAQLGPEVDAERVLATVGLTAADADPRLPAVVASTGFRHLLAPVRDAAALARVRVDGPALTRLHEALGTGVLYLTAIDADAGTAEARSFFTDAGPPAEDPATGSAAGPLCAYVASRTGQPRLTIRQGVAMGRPSRLVCVMEGERPRVGGDCVVLARGTIALP